MIRVSIIIPAYNASAFIERSLSSAINQTYQSLEYVIVDDCSSDDTLSKIKTIFERSSRADDLVLVCHERNMGVSEARNSGLRNASGDYIYFLDSDDELPLDAIESLLSSLDEAALPDLVIGEFDVTGSPRSRFGRISMEEGLIDDNRKILGSFLDMRWPDMTCNKLEKRSFLLENKMNFLVGILHEDALWGFELAMNARSMVVSRKVTYIYHIQESSITQRKVDQNFQSLLVVLSSIVSFIGERRLYETQPAIWSYLADLRIYFFKEMVRADMSVAYIEKMVSEVNDIMSKMPSFPYERRLASRLKDLAYRLPVRIAYLYVKLLVSLSK